MNIPRDEHPNPQWERETWKNLNGPWEFEFDFGCSAVERRLWEKERFDREILVPFCPESKLSGIGYTDFISGVAYRRAFTLSQEELAGKAHSYELEPCGCTVLCVDYKMSGVGSNSCGPSLLPQYRLEEGQFDFAFSLLME